MNMTVLFKKYTYGLLLIATTIIGFGLNFGSCSFSANDIPESAIITTGSVNLEYTNTTVTNQMYNLTISDLDATSDIPFSYYCMYVYNFDSGSLGGNAWITFGFGTINVRNWTVVRRGFSNEYGDSNFFVEPNRFWLDRVSQFDNGGLLCAYNYRRYINLGIAETSVNSRTYIFDYIVFDYNKLSFGSSVDCSQDSNYLQCLEQVSTLSGNLTTYQGMYERLENDYDLLEGNYNSCTSELSSCLENSGSSGSGDVQWSSLYINNIQHLGASNINITIPEEISWSYTNENDEFDLNVEGYGYDQEKMQNIVNTQFTPPTSEDIENVIRKIADFIPLLAVMLLIVYARRLIKKVF